MAVNKSLFFKEMTLKSSNEKIAALLKERVRFRANLHFQPGNLILTSYNAKYKEHTYDKTPLAMILKRGFKHTLVLNFHWLPVAHRMYLVKHIMTINKDNIRDGKPLQFSYEELKPMLKSLGYAPCIRKYINHRMGRIGVVVKPDRLTEVARLKTESFTKGRYSAAQLFQMAKQKHKKSKKGKRR